MLPGFSIQKAPPSPAGQEKEGLFMSGRRHSTVISVKLLHWDHTPSICTAKEYA